MFVRAPVRICLSGGRQTKGRKYLRKGSNLHTWEAKHERKSFVLVTLKVTFPKVWCRTASFMTSAWTVEIYVTHLVQQLFCFCRKNNHIRMSLVKLFFYTILDSYCTKRDENPIIPDIGLQCSHIRTVISLRFLQRSEAASRCQSHIE